MPVVQASGLSCFRVGNFKRDYSMSRISFVFVLITLMAIPFTSVADSIDVKIKGIDDGVKTSRQQDYKEPVLFAKREAIEGAGVKIKALTTVKMLIINSDYIESNAEAVLLPGYDILDMGYSADGTYQVVLIGKVQLAAAGTKEVSEPVRGMRKDHPAHDL